MSVNGAKLAPARRGAATAAALDQPPYTLHQSTPEPLSRLALQRMRRPCEDPEELLDVKEGESALRLIQMKSAAFLRIHYELLRYCEGEIDGLSVLIAGQRGAGKTTLTKMLIQRVMQDSKGLIPLPLLLHGPTIIDPEAVAPNGEETDGSAPQEKQRALRQIITALYRSLSTAIYDAWLTAAEEASAARRAQRELLGLRAHLDLRLERAPDPDVLRKIWSRAGFLNDGVAFFLRPAVKRGNEFGRDDTIPAIAGDPDDQGLREIVALSACADAYRVILGKTTETLQSAQAVAQEQELKVPSASASGSKDSKGGEDGKAKSSAEKLGPPAIGTVAGGLVAVAGAADSANLVLGLAAGVVVWLTSWAAMTYGVRRSKQETRRELTVDVKWDVDRLERDLPVLLKRVKDAGFAPIFVLDELDKAKDARGALDRFLGLAKHIVTDHAAFLFLTNRDYYEQLITSENVDIGYAS